MKVAWTTVKSLWVPHVSIPSAVPAWTNLEYLIASVVGIGVGDACGDGMAPRWRTNLSASVSGDGNGDAAAFPSATV